MTGPHGAAFIAAEFAAWRDFIRRTAETWGEGRDGDIWLAGTPNADAAWGRLQRACASPAVARRYYESWADGLTAWDVLPAGLFPPVVRDANVPMVF